MVDIFVREPTLTFRMLYNSAISMFGNGSFQHVNNGRTICVAVRDIVPTRFKCNLTHPEVATLHSFQLRLEGNRLELCSGYAYLFFGRSLSGYDQTGRKSEG